MHKTFAAKNKETSSQTAGAASEKVSPFHVGAGGDRLPAGLTRTHNAKKAAPATPFCKYLTTRAP